MSHLKIILSFVLLTLMSNASATLIYTDRAEWEAAVGAFTTDTYSDILIDQEFVTLDRGDYFLDGSAANVFNDILIDVPPYAFVPEDPALTTGPRVNLGGLRGSFLITLDSHINAFGFDLINFDVDFDRGSIAIDGEFASLFPADSGTAAFFGFIGNAGSVIQITSNASSNNSSYHAFTNVSTGTTDVPEPSTLAIFTLGMMGLASRRFKK